MCGPRPCEYRPLCGVLHALALECQSSVLECRHGEPPLRGSGIGGTDSYILAAVAYHALFVAGVAIMLVADSVVGGVLAFDGVTVAEVTQARVGHALVLGFWLWGFLLVWSSGHPDSRPVMLLRPSQFLFQ